MTIVIFIIILGIIVLVHELGHLLTAKMFNVYCKEFSIGMGPKIKSWQRNETMYSIRALPLGGFVSMAGEEGVDAENIPFNRTLKGIHPLKRIVVMLAGVFMNIVLAWIIFVGVFVIQGQRLMPPPPIIYGIVENSAAEQAGLLANDLIVKVTFSDQTSITPRNFYEIITFTNLYKDEMILTVERGNQTLNISITPRFNETENRYMMGLLLPPAEVVELNFFTAVLSGSEYVLTSIKDIFNTLTRLVRGIGLQAISGPLGIYDVTAQQAQQGILSLVVLTAILSINVGIFNLLPLPLLDGGRVLITVTEMILRKPINQKLEQALMTASIFLVLMLMLFVTWQDILRLFS